MSRLTVAALIVVGVSGLRACRAMSGCYRPVRAVASRRDDSQATMHRAGVQLCRLGQTYGEPGCKHTGENARDQSAAHESNIRWTRDYERPDGAALAIAPRAATSVSSSSGTHSITQRTVF